MRPTPTVILAALVVVAAALAGCGDDAGPATATSTTTTEPEATTTTTEPDDDRTISVSVAGDRVTGGGRHTVDRGSVVTIVVDADRDDEVHLHGYDLFADVAPGGPATITFTADIPGVFEVELERAGFALLELAVS